MFQRFDVNTKGTDLAQDLAPYIAGKTLLITGVSPGGHGAFFAETISSLEQGLKLLILASRSLSKLKGTQDKIRSINSKVEVRPLVLDLQSFDSVRAAAKEVIAQTEHIDVLVNNAGVMAPPYSKTIDGFESTFQTNHLSPFLFTNWIMEKLMSALEQRVVIVSSNGYRLGHVRYNDYNFHMRLSQS
ncbi:unnamed protein product [Zymoseptoria tritici ST99CH_1A5]|uniref:Ketoreductase (KR) domain-containing protein n=1 Tax=Zymoseptoria tritici ST99CH_1A5 TaxID=1276529 RepID=A0A1Y6LRD9_ZYMTR|nr:unnamed protein product [Zymoseptoria tritici ST99CH_1A5]